MKAVGSDIKAAFEKGHIRQPHRDRLGVKYKAREAELKVTPTTEPAPTDSKSD